MKVSALCKLFNVLNVVHAKKLFRKTDKCSSAHACTSEILGGFSFFGVNKGSARAEACDDRAVKITEIASAETDAIKFADSFPVKRINVVLYIGSAYSGNHYLVYVLQSKAVLIDKFTESAVHGCYGVCCTDEKGLHKLSLTVSQVKADDLCRAESHVYSENDFSFHIIIYPQIRVLQVNSNIKIKRMQELRAKRLNKLFAIKGAVITFYVVCKGNCKQNCGSFSFCKASCAGAALKY